MNTEIIFESVNRKYAYVMENMEFCKNAALSDDFPAHATWIHPPTLARWLYGSIEEFADEYYQTARKLKEPNEALQNKFFKQQAETMFKVLESKDNILVKYPELSEVLK